MIVNKKIYGASLLHIAIFVITIVLFVTAVCFNYAYKDKLSVIKSKYHYVLQENQQYEQSLINLNNQLPTFLNAKERGFLGGALRIDWVQTVNSLVEIHSLPRVDFNLQNNHYMKEEGFIYWNERVHVYASDMDVSFQFLHELDFYHFFSDLQSVAKGMADINQCQLSYKEAGHGELSMLTGSCNIRWFSLANELSHWESL